MAKGKTRKFSADAHERAEGKAIRSLEKLHGNHTKSKGGKKGRKHK